jgi:hypothetical protein
MKMPEPVGYLSQYNLTMLEQGYPQTIVMLKGAKRDLPLYDKQALIDLLEEAIKVDWTQVMREGGLVTWGDADTLGDRVIEKLQAMKETL